MSTPKPVATPVDHAARLTIRDDHATTLLVEAGAGTGKTTALVGRIVAMIASGAARLEEIAAITFTEAAAAELRDRIRSALEAAARGALDRVATEEERQRCADALHHLDDAPLSTLHGFAQRILATHPLEAGLPPRFEVLDDIGASIEFDERYQQLVAVLHDDASLDETLGAAYALGLDLARLRGVAEALYEHPERLAEGMFPARPVPLDPSGVLHGIEAALAHRASCTAGDDRLAAHLDGLRELRTSVEAADDPLDALDVLGSWPSRSASRMGNRNHWPDIAAVRGACAAVEDARAAWLDRARSAVLHTLVARLVRFSLDEAERRRHEGRLTFHDLLVLARELLRRDPAVLDALRGRHRVLLVDEFQDTDPLQVDLAVLLASSDPEAGIREWWEVTVDAGRLFLVGDPKQSIYRFRSADLAVYDRVAAELGAEKATLRQNFRSVPGVLAWVNHVFAAVLGEGEPGVQAAHVELVAARDPHPEHPVPVRVIGGPSEGPADAVRATEADDVAAAIRQAKAEGWPVVCADGSVRPVAYHDVAILLPTRTALEAIEDALEAAGIPARVESQSLIFSTAEVRDLLSALTAIDDPTDEVALVASLRSPGFGCSDVDLVEYRQAGGRWSYLTRPPASLPPDHPVVTALESLRKLHDARWWRTVSETVSALVEERNLLALAVAHRRPREQWRRIRFFCERARAFDDSGHTGVRAFVEWARRQTDEGARAVEVVVPEPDDDAVRILTVHGSKGLEFPVVVLAGLGAQRRSDRPPVLWTAHGPQISLAVGNSARVTTPGYDEALEHEQRHSAAEDLRLLYVAATRARDHLVVSLHHNPARAAGCHAARISEHLDGAPHQTLVPGGVDPPALLVEPQPTPTPTPTPPTSTPTTLDDRAALLTARAHRLATAARPASIAATAIARLAAPASDGTASDAGRDPRDLLDEEEAAVLAELDGAAPSVPGPGRRGRAGTAVGRAVHAVLQSIDLATREGLAATVRAQAQAEGIAGREREVRTLVEHVLDTDIVHEAVSGGRYWREVPVAAAFGGGSHDVVVEGFVDLLVETPDGLVVVDYKTDRVDDDAGVDALLARYSAQGATYALALEAALGRPVARCVFVFAQPGRAIERDVPDLPGVVAAVRALLAAR